MIPMQLNPVFMMVMGSAKDAYQVILFGLDLAKDLTVHLSQDFVLAVLSTFLMLMDCASLILLRTVSCTMLMEDAIIVDTGIT